MLNDGLLATADRDRADRALPLILAGWAVVAFALRPFQNAPFIDDWVYAWSVENLLKTGRLEALDYSGNLTQVQTIWGAVFCVPFGFSFTALRISTWVLSCLALVGIYQLILEAGGSRRGAAIGTVAAAVCPLTLMLSVTFMTDIPLLAAEIWALVFFLRALRTRSMPALWTGIALTSLASGIRFVGVVPAVAMCLALLFARGGWGRARGRFLLPLVSILTTAALLLYDRAHVRHVVDLEFIPGPVGARLAALGEYGILLLPQALPSTLESVAISAGIVLLPLSIGLGWFRRDRVGVALVGLTIAAVCARYGVTHHVGPSPLEEGQTWSLVEIGASLPLLPGWRPSPISPAAALVLAIVAWSISAVAVRAAARPAAGVAGVHLCWWVIAGLILMAALVWLMYDRYILPVLPPLLALLLGRSAWASWRRTAIPLAIMGVVSFSGVHDHLALNRAIWQALDDLRARGVPAAQIDAGYVANGWLQYAHPDDAHRNAEGALDVPWVNGDASLPWVVGVGRVPGTRQVATYPYRRWWPGAGGEILVMAREPAIAP